MIDFVVVQYGFVTIFVAAFPLAPLFALVNNIIETRLDANKFVKLLRRPVAERVKDMGAWMYTLSFVTALCVICNGLIIAFTSTIIDREMYNRVYNNDTCDGDCQSGFVAWSSSPVTLNSLLRPIEYRSRSTSFTVPSLLKLPMYTNNGTSGKVCVRGFHC